MSASDWRNGLIDLTADDDHEKPVIYDPTYGPSYLKVPVAGTNSIRPAQTVPRSQPQPYNVQVPLPVGASHSLPPNAHTLPWQFSHNTFSSISSQSYGVPSPNHAWNNTGNGGSYLPVQQSNDIGVADFTGPGRGEKRRKTSVHGQSTVPNGLPMHAAKPWGQYSFEVQEQGRQGRVTFLEKGNERPNLQSHLADAPRSDAMRWSGASRNPETESTHLPQKISLEFQGAPTNTGLHCASLTPIRSTPRQILPDEGTRKDAFSVQYEDRILRITSKRIPKTEADFQARSQEFARLTQFSVWSRPRPPMVSPGPGSSTDDDHDADSVMSGSSFRNASVGLASCPRPAVQLGMKQRPVPPSRTEKPFMKGATSFSEEEEHLLIFLKEVKRLKWADITKEFAKDIPGRPYHTLQSRYSTKTNKRDRSLDPPVLSLPPRWASEAVVDWATVHTSTPGPRERVHLLSAPLPERYATQEAHSTGDESNDRQPRPRRAPMVNYDVRKIRLQYDEVLGDASQAGTPEHTTEPDQSTRSETPEAPQRIPGPAIAVENDPIDVNFDPSDARFALPLERAARGSSSQPYLSTDQRLAIQNPSDERQWDQLCSRQLQGAVMHIDFSSSELKAVEEAICKIIGYCPDTRHNTLRARIRSLLRYLSDPKILQLVHILRKRLLSRNSDSVAAFIQDAKAGKLSKTPKVQRLAAARKFRNMSSIDKNSTASWIRKREIGASSQRGWRTASRDINYQVRNKIKDTLGPALTWTGASSDIHTVAWGPYGDCFAAGAVAVTDPDSMQYNRSNNLLFGDLMSDTIHELAEHNVQREKTEKGANSTHAMFVSQDPELFTTVTAVAFAPSGKFMYSSGYDNQVCVWDLSSPQPQLAARLKHKAKVELMVVNNLFGAILATAAQKTDGKAVKVVRMDEDNPLEVTTDNYFSEKAVSRADLNILPQALQFDPNEGRLLLCGFGANVRTDTKFDMTGDLCLWDVDTAKQLNIHGSNRNVFDVTFNPNRRHLPLFAAACVANGNVNRRTRSVIRLYDERSDDRYGCPLEIECRALDMNDVVWCPHDEQLIAAGCTDGRVYVWDIRRSNEPLRTLSHGHSLMPLPEDVPHERTDTGVRFLSWGENSTRLYSGSSDGVVKAWDVTRSPEETFIKDIVTLDSGIMAGKFSPENDKIILGEVNGSVSILDVGRSDCSIKSTKKMNYVPYNWPLGLEQDEQITSNGTGHAHDENSPGEAGVEQGSWLLQSGQFSIARLGNLPVRQVVQGPNYQGPFDQSVDAPFLREQALQFQLSMSTSTTPQCTIPACKDSVIKVTDEETGDSMRSQDRIPDTLRTEWLNVDDEARVPPGRTKCIQCGRSARPPGPDIPLDASAMCERCSFSCLRCGSPNSIAPATTTFMCGRCGRVWDIGSLGYEYLYKVPAAKPKLNVPQLRRFGREMLEERTEEEASYGDEMNALTDYYFSLAIDGPESPPL